MAPPTPVFGKDELEPLLKKVKPPCVLKSLIQNECTFNGEEYICVPFKRLFKECLLDSKTKDGRASRIVRIEITDRHTNDGILEDQMLKRFWEADLHQ